MTEWMLWLAFAGCWVAGVVTAFYVGYCLGRAEDVMSRMDNVE